VSDVSLGMGCQMKILYTNLRLRKAARNIVQLMENSRVHQSTQMHHKHAIKIEIYTRLEIE
jgi:hypothetical protein